MGINLTDFFNAIGVVGGSSEEGTQYDFFRGIEWQDGGITNDQYEFFKKIGKTRYEFFKDYNTEYDFYKDIDDDRIYNFSTFYKFAASHISPNTGLWLLITGYWDDHGAWFDDVIWDETEYTITYLGGDSTSGTDFSTTLPTGLKILPGADFMNGSDAFVSWNTQENGLGTKYEIGATFNLDSDITLYAMYETHTIVLMPDTQYYVAYENAALTSQIDYLIANEENADIEFVAGVGDVVNSTTTLQFEFAESEYSRLDTNSIPHSLALGNHDYSPYWTKESALFNSYFPLSKFQAMPTYGGALDTRSDNTYHIVNMGGNDLLMLSLEYGPTDAVVTWANSILASYSTTPAIITTHAYLDDSGVLLAPGIDHAASDMINSTTDVNDGIDLWNDLVYPNNNVRLVACGHDGTETVSSAYKLGLHADGSEVHQVLTNGQYLSGDRMGYLVMCRFTLDKLHFMTYSPYKDVYNGETLSQMVFDWVW